MFSKSPFFSGFNKPSTVPAGNLSKAAFVGAKTVNGPALLNEVTNPAAFTAATNVVWSLLPTAVWTMFGTEVSSTTFSCPPELTSVVSEVVSDVAYSFCLQPMAMNKLANNNVLIDFFIINTFNILSNYTYKVPNYEIVILWAQS